MYQTVVPFISKALDRSLGETNIELIYANLLKDLNQLFIITDDKYMTLGICITDIIKYASFKSIKVNFIAGSRMTDWVKDLDNYLVDFAKSQGATKIEAIGRRGWVRQLAELGYKQKYYYLHREV